VRNQKEAGALERMGQSPIQFHDFLMPQIKRFGGGLEIRENSVGEFETKQLSRSLPRFTVLRSRPPKHFESGTMIGSQTKGFVFGPLGL
jgi:hypothetical protein